MLGEEVVGHQHDALRRRNLLEYGIGGIDGRVA